MGHAVWAIGLLFCVLSFASDDALNNCGGFVKPSKALQKYELQVVK